MIYYSPRAVYKTQARSNPRAASRDNARENRFLRNARVDGCFRFYKKKKNNGVSPKCFLSYTLCLCMNDTITDIFNIYNEDLYISGAFAHPPPPHLSIALSNQR